MSVEELFGSYLSMAYPRERIVGDQLIEIRRAFYAGVWGALNADEDKKSAMADECEKFKQDVMDLTNVSMKLKKGPKWRG